MIVVYRCRCGETSRVVERRCSSWWILLLSVRSWCRGGSRLENKAVNARRETPTATTRKVGCLQRQKSVAILQRGFCLATDFPLLNQFQKKKTWFATEYPLQI